MSDDEWAVFGRALSEELQRLETYAIILLLDPDPRLGQRRFVQFLQNPDHLRAEVAGDAVEYPPGNLTTGLLTVRQQRLLGAVGWLPPEHDDGDHNWFCRIAWPATSEEVDRLVDAVVTALRDVQDTPSPGALVYRSWLWGNERRKLHIPGVEPDAGYEAA